MATITSIVEGATRPLRDYIGALYIEMGPDGWQVRLCYSLMVPVDLGSEVRGYTITIDEAQIPSGITVYASHRWPDSIHPLPLGADYAAELRAQLNDLQQSGLVGTLDVAIRRFQGQVAERWLIKTHAGSDAERAAWVRTLPRRPGWGGR